MKHYTATFISFAGFIVPIFAGLIGWGFLNEKITWHFYASCLIILFGLYLFYQDELKYKALASK
jgi:drug/metabolite transporter (DMT)-like permease